MKKLVSLFVLGGMLFTSLYTTSVRAMHHEPNIVEIASSNDAFETLVQAVVAADLAGALSGEGPFTVFAPVDEAFANLPEGTVETLLKPENIQSLQNVLTYHVLPGAIHASALRDGMTATTLQGDTVTFTKRNDQFYINEALITATDISASNGVIHVIDAVILPPVKEQPSKATDSIVDIAVSNPDFSTLVSLLSQEDLVDTLSQPGPFTVFAPTNEAFDRMPNYYKRLLASNPSLLKEVLLAHVVPGNLMASDVVVSKRLSSANGLSIPIGLWNGKAYIGDSQITATDIKATNGVVHVIDRVIVPRDLLR